ncbi:MAG: ATP F0F1 synthase subunit B, partial [Jannaschia sp.]
MRYTFPLLFVASPALAASGPFFSLSNTDFVVWIGFLVFIGVVVYFKVPG